MFNLCSDRSVFIVFYITSEAAGRTKVLLLKLSDNRGTIGDNPNHRSTSVNELAHPAIYAVYLYLRGQLRGQSKVKILTLLNKGVI